jgi:hypothetical protein
MNLKTGNSTQKRIFKITQLSETNFQKNPMPGTQPPTWVIYIQNSI